MNEKAFTLIELLAVIVILAIILIIAVPRITQIVDGAEKKSLVSSAKIAAKAIETKAVTAEQDGKYTYNKSNKSFQSDIDPEVSLKIKGKFGDSDSVTISNGKVSIINFSSKNYVITTIDYEPIKKTSQSLGQELLSGPFGNNIEFKVYSGGKVIITGTGAIGDDTSIIESVISGYASKHLLGSDYSDYMSYIIEDSNYSAFIMLRISGWTNQEILDVKYYGSSINEAFPDMPQSAEDFLNILGTANAPAISEIILEGNITTIGEFSLSHLYKPILITLPDSLILIKDFAFANSDAVNIINIPNKSDLYISSKAFCDWINIDKKQDLLNSIPLATIEAQVVNCNQD